MRESLLTVRVANEQDVVMVRQRADQLAGLLGFSRADSTRIATAVSEIARNALQYANGGKVQFSVDTGERGQRLEIVVSDEGGGIRQLDRILSGRYRSESGLGLGIVGSRRLMDELEIESSPEGTTIRMAQWLPSDAAAIDRARIDEVVTELTRGKPRSPVEEIQRQNQELLATLDRERIAREEAESANRARDEFFALLSHELRTPLTSILGWSEFLESSQLDAEQETAVRSIGKSGSALKNLINQLLEVSRILTGKVTLDLETIDLNDIAREATDMLKPTAAEKELDLTIDLWESPLRLQADHSRLRQVVWNLLSNAIKFTREGGRVSLCVERINGAAQIIVEDTGMGIEPEVLPHIFERLRQAESGAARLGLGLGLSLVKHFVELHNGEVRAESDGPEQGSRFVVTLPVQ